MEAWIKLVVLSAGGAVGVNARYWLGVWMNRWASPQFPWATFTINVTGSFLIGLLTITMARWLPHPNFRLLVVTGFLGGYTTFSTFEFESATLWERGEMGLMAANMAGSVVAGFAAVLLGIALARGIAPTQVAAASHEPPPRAVASAPSLQASPDGPIASGDGAGLMAEKDGRAR